MTNVVGRVRSILPPEARVLGSRLRRSNRTIRRRVERHLDIPPSLKPSPRKSGSVWGVAMMRNEADTARHVIEHMLAQGVDTVLVADNNSTDETVDVLSSLSTTHSVHVVKDRLMAYEQSAKMTALATIARHSGADWIVPFDADELWFAIDRSVGDCLRATGATVVRAELHNVFPGIDDDEGEPDPFLRLRHIDTEAAAFRKVAFRSHWLSRLEMGNVDVIRRGDRTDGLFIAHFPWRSIDQMVEKLRHGRTAMEATAMTEELGFHWRVGGAWPEEQIHAAWADLQAGTTVADLAWSPSGQLIPDTPGRWATWGLAGARPDDR